MEDLAGKLNALRDHVNRRGFLKRARYLALAAATFPYLLRDWAGSALAAVTIEDISPDMAGTSPPVTPSPPASGTSLEQVLFQSPQTFAFHLPNGPSVQVFGFHGGEPVAQYVTGTVAPDGSLPKKLSGLRYQDIVFYYLPIPGAVLNTWLIDSVLGRARALNGGIHTRTTIFGSSGSPATNSYGSHVSFTNAYVKRIDFPEVDSGTNAPAPLRITLAIQQAEQSTGGSPTLQMIQATPSNSPLKGLFSLSIQSIGLSEITRIEPLAFSAALTSAARGAGPREISTLQIQLPESKAADLYAWHKDFVIKGLNSDAHERAGTIQWLSPQSPSQPILTLKLSRLGILSVVRLPSKPGYVQAEMYCEKLVPVFFNDTPAQ